jgi:hypothetical protein
MPRLDIGGDAPVFDGSFRSNLATCLEQYASAKKGYHEIHVTLGGSKDVRLDIICIEELVDPERGCMVCDECRVMGIALLLPSTARVA